MVFDTDDLYEGHDNMHLLLELKAANPLFRMTAFCVQARGSAAYWDSLPDWIECAAHGEYHPHPREAEDWPYAKAMSVLSAKPARFVRGWKSPGWRVSDGTYRALEIMGWWIADHPDNNDRRPALLPTHVVGSGDHVHTHVQDVCGNGLNETFPTLLERVRNATSFEFVSEMVAPWRPLVTA